ncbi:MAG: Trans-aconitate 2-methyltransferase [Candidatus Brocadia sinica]|nr:MAG: Trans-aconitate 2-methyltransferase [Candidatus Brocadia sinica]
MERILESELMEEEGQVCAYVEADFEDAHSRFIALFQDMVGHKGINGYVLDLGCGYGDIAIRFARAYPRCIVHGIDGSEAMIHYGKGILREAHDIQDRVELIHGRLPEAVLPRIKYDIIISNSLLHHLPNPQVLYQVIQRYTISGAPVFIMDLKRPKTIDEARVLVETHVANEPEVLKRDFYNSLLAAFEEREVLEQLKEAKLNNLSVKVASDRHIVISGYIP